MQSLTSQLFQPCVFSDPSMLSVGLPATCNHRQSRSSSMLSDARKIPEHVEEVPLSNIPPFLRIGRSKCHDSAQSLTCLLHSTTTPFLTEGGKGKASWHTLDRIPKGQTSQAQHKRCPLAPSDMYSCLSRTCGIQGRRVPGSQGLGLSLLTVQPRPLPAHPLREVSRIWCAYSGTQGV